MTPALAILTALIGAIVGSFVALVADRWPRGEDIVVSPSYCRSCGKRLGPQNLVPIISYCLQRGRCSGCSAAIPADLVLAELAGAAIALEEHALLHNWLGWLALGGLGSALLLLILLDMRHFWLPDAITLPLLVGGLVIGPGALDLLAGAPLVDRLTGAFCGFIVLEGMRRGYRMLRGYDGMGGGDPKLLAAIGSWLGYAALPGIVLMAALAGLGWVAVAALRGRPAGGDTPIPLGAGIAAATLVWLGVAGL